MKIKNDFVTNSSSTNYIVKIPPNFKIEDHLSMLEQGGILRDERRGTSAVVNPDYLKLAFEDLMDAAVLDNFSFAERHVYTNLGSEEMRKIKTGEFEIENRRKILELQWAFNHLSAIFSELGFIEREGSLDGYKEGDKVRIAVI